MNTLKSSEEFVVGKHNIGYVDSDFKERHYDKAFSPREIGKFQTLGRYMKNAADIEKSLNPGKCELGDVLAFLKNPPEGTKDGYYNLFLIGEYVVSVYWDASYGAWDVDSWNRDEDWRDDSRVFSPGQDLDPSSSTLESSNSSQPSQPAQSKLEHELVSILIRHCGEHGQNEGAVETLERIIRERDLLLKRVSIEILKPAHLG